MEISEIKVLLVEDDADDSFLTRDAMSHIKGTKITVDCVGTLSTALQSLAKGKYDLILLDLYLPDSSGLTTIDAIRKKAPSVPIVVLTGLDNETISDLAMQKGVQGYFSKSQADAVLLERVIKSALQYQQQTSSPKNIGI